MSRCLKVDADTTEHPGNERMWRSREPQREPESQGDPRVSREALLSLLHTTIKGEKGSCEPKGDLSE